MITSNSKRIKNIATVYMIIKSAAPIVLMTLLSFLQSGNLLRIPR